MKRSAIVFLGLFLAFTALAKVGNGVIRSADAVVVELEEPLSSGDQDEPARWDWSGVEPVRVDDLRSQVLTYQMTPDIAGWQFDPGKVVITDSYAPIYRKPVYGGAIIREFQCDAGGVRSEGLIWGQQGWANLIDR